MIEDAGATTISFDPNCRPNLVRDKARYVDRMEKRGGEWKIAARKCLVEWGSEGMQSEGAAALNLVVGTIARDSSDCSYERPLTSDLARHGLRLGV